ncbi:MAG: bifunctional metallophosphatase/5'-nucleotidase [Hyphomicrobiaceae bacterium]|nr:bifunctional metallophosphatase/5'-nucleotidase [Hyphomicrobiaceae bacterium]
MLHPLLRAKSLSRWLPVAVAGLAVSLGIIAGSARAQPRLTRLGIVLVSDLDTIETGARGGYARLAAALAAERAKGPVLLIHAGDGLGPTLLGALDRGEHAVDLLDRLEPDFYVPGAQDFAMGGQPFQARMGSAPFAKLAANLRQPNGQRLEGFADAKIIERDGVKIGLIGLTDDRPSRDGSLQDLKIADPLRTGMAVARDLREQGADLIIAITHTERSVDRQLRDSGLIDIVLSGEDHDLAVEFDGRTALVESRAQAEVVAALDLELAIDEQGGRRDVAWWPRFRVIDTADLPPEPAMEARVAEFRRTLELRLDEPLVPTDIAIDTRFATQRSGDSILGALVSDAIKVATKADCALVPAGMIGGYRDLPVGTVLSRRDLYEFVSGDARSVVLEVPGEMLLLALEAGLSDYGSGSGRFPQVSGIHAVVDVRLPPGKRVLSASVGGRPVDPRKTYRLATLDAVSHGAEGYRMFRLAEPLVDERAADLAFNQVAAYLAAVPAITAPTRGRIAFR